MVSVDVSLIVQIINFIILIFLLNFVLYKPIRNILAQRKQKVDGFQKDIDTCIESAKEKEEAFSQGIKNARAPGTETFDDGLWCCRGIRLGGGSGISRKGGGHDAGCQNGGSCECQSGAADRHFLVLSMAWKSQIDLPVYSAARFELFKIRGCGG